MERTTRSDDQSLEGRKARHAHQRASGRYVGAAWDRLRVRRLVAVPARGRAFFSPSAMTTTPCGDEEEGPVRQCADRPLKLKRNTGLPYPPRISTNPQFPWSR